MCRNLLHVVLILFFFGISCYSQSIRVGLFSTSSLKKVKFANATTEFHLIGDSSYIGTLGSLEFMEVFPSSEKKIGVIFNGIKYNGYSKISVIASKFHKSIEISSLSPVLKSRSYEGDFEISNSKNSIRIVNILDINDYLEGVVESESGIGQKLEYYKVQAVISRTYALKSWDKHKNDGYNLCDQVHCQAYLHKRNGSAIIDSAVLKTDGIILQMENGDFASSYFSANCGGQTCDPKQVWNEEIEGLKSFKDTFCIHTKQSHWSKRISKDEWSNFLVKEYDFPIDDSLSKSLMFSWGSNTRTAFFIHPGYGISMKELREQFKLKSSFFSCEEDGEDVILNGNGYGHGVGLCQEGAMRMARLGYSYDQILSYYFPLPQLTYRDALVFDR